MCRAMCCLYSIFVAQDCCRKEHIVGFVKSHAKFCTKGMLSRSKYVVLKLLILMFNDTDVR